VDTRAWIAAAATVALGAAGLALTAGRAPGPVRYQADATVLENAQHGPELCLAGVLTSLPPQCGGVPVANWKWSAVAGVESRGGVTWADQVRVVGTFDGARFTLTEPPRASPPVALPPTCGHPLTVQTPLLERVQAEVTARARELRLLGVGLNPCSGRLEARVVVADQAVRDEVARRWPGLVDLDPALTPVR
jgi:hypothetical protein